MPRIGLLSDSHGRVPTTRQAVAALLERDVDMLIHLGDLGSMEVIDELVLPRQKPVASAEASPGNEPVATAIKVRLVFGNVDWDRVSMGQYAEHLGLLVDDPVGKIDLGDGNSLVFTHGDNDDAVEEALAQGVTYLCHGHSHRTRDEKVRATRVLNPGALFRAKRYTVGVLDTESDKFEIIELP